MAESGRCSSMRIERVACNTAMHLPRRHQPPLTALLCSAVRTLASLAHALPAPAPAAAGGQFWEPQGVAVRHQLPAWDEGFRGYGLNKVQHAWHAAQRGYRFKVGCS